MTCYRRVAAQSGVTLVELLVAMTLSLLIVLAAVSAVIGARHGFSSVDSASQIRDNARFAAELLQRVVVQAGYQDVAFAVSAPVPSSATSTIAPPVSGFDNALLPTTIGADPLAGVVSGDRSNSAGGCTAAPDPACVNGSDVLVLRYQSGESIAGSGLSDGTMVNCVGEPETSAPAASDARIVSIFHIARTAGGEPALICTSKNASGAWTSQVVASGIEGFQVLYGADGVTPNTAPTGVPDSVPDRFLRAEELTVAGDAAATDANWRRVRSLRIGLLIRGARGSVADRASAIEPLYPLGTGASSPADAGNPLTPPDDSRLRQTMTFTLHLRNAQSF